MEHDYAERRRRTARAAAIARHTAPVAPISGSGLAVLGRVFFSPVPAAPVLDVAGGGPPAERAVDAAGAGVFGAGAERFGFPSGVRGIPGVG